MLRKQLVHGLVAGVVGAALMAAWFVAIDTISGNPLFTFTFVAQLVFGDGAPTLIVPLYLLLHFVLFAVAGVVASRGFDLLRITPTIPLGAVVGLLLFDLAFYAGVVIIGTNVVSRVGWPVVLTGNVLGGIGIAGYLRVAAGHPVLGWQGVLQQHQIVREGLLAGIIGAAAVALWFLIIDVSQGRPLFTPAALGSAIFIGTTDANAVQVSFTTVLGYTLLHVTAFALVGLVAARLFAEAERHPPLILALVLLFVTLEVMSLGVLAAIAIWLFESVPWWAVVIANLAAAAAMGVYLWRRHPALQQSLLHTQVEDFA